MKTKTKSAYIQGTVEQVFSAMDNFSMTGMHMSEKSWMMMGSHLELEVLSKIEGQGAVVRWHGKIIGIPIDFTQRVTKWKPPYFKSWETNEGARLIIMSWYEMHFSIKEQIPGDVLLELSISYLPPREWYFKIAGFFLAPLYCNWCLDNMLKAARLHRINATANVP